MSDANDRPAAPKLPVARRVSALPPPPTPLPPAPPASIGDVATIAPPPTDGETPTVGGPPPGTETTAAFSQPVVAPPGFTVERELGAGGMGVAIWPSSTG